MPSNVVKCVVTYHSGIHKLHLITSQGAYELRIELANWEGVNKYAKYETFKVGTPLDNYVLTADGYNGDAGKSLGISCHVVYF